jgi:hypothetical protein
MRGAGGVVTGRGDARGSGGVGAVLVGRGVKVR